MKDAPEIIFLVDTQSVDSLFVEFRAEMLRKICEAFSGVSTHDKSAGIRRTTGERNDDQ